MRIIIFILIFKLINKFINSGTRIKESISDVGDVIERKKVEFKNLNRDDSQDVNHKLRNELDQITNLEYELDKANEEIEMLKVKADKLEKDKREIESKNKVSSKRQNIVLGLVMSEILDSPKSLSNKKY